MSKTIYKKMRQAFFTRQGPGYRLPIDGNRTNSTTYLSLPVMDLIHHSRGNTFLRHIRSILAAGRDVSGNRGITQQILVHRP